MTGRTPLLSRSWLWLPIILGAVLLALFFQSFQPGEILFANDTTLGQMKAPPNRLPEAFTGSWHNGVWVGIEGVAVAPTISALLTLVLSPEIFLKIYAPLTLLFLGFSAWLFFRQLEFDPRVCLLGGLAAGLNMHFFSIACWGLGSWNIAAGMIFLALAALNARSIPQLWARATLAGLAVGMNVMEGYDVGVILSAFVGIYIIWHAFTRETSTSKKMAIAICTESLVIFFAAFIAVHSIFSLVSTQVKGVVGTGQDTQSKEERWDFATRWSLPKLETLRVVTPGVFGYRMSSRINVSDKSSAYWGTVGRDPRIIDILGDNPERRNSALEGFHLPEQQRSDLSSSDPSVRSNADRALLGKLESSARYSGSGEYAGVLVSILALFGLANSCRRAHSPFSARQRRAVWFWAAAAIISLLMSWGRHAVFYRMLYQLPYVSTIRNPIKFLHPFHVAWVILAAYGLEAIWKRYMQPGAAQKALSIIAGFERRWVIVSAVVVGASIAGAFIFNSWKPHLVEYLTEQGFDPRKAISIADFANVEARWSVFWLAASVGAVAAVLNGMWTGPRARTAWIIVGLIVVLDLARSDLPWIHYFNYQKEYAENPIIDFLQEKPYEHRVAGRLEPRGVGSGLNPPMGQLYDYWQQNDFPYHGIQAMDFSQWPRVPELDATYIKNFALHGETAGQSDLWPAERLWELTGTRYILNTAAMAIILSEKADPRHNIVVREYLTVHARPGLTVLEDAGDLTAEEDKHGNCAFIEFTNALPRAGLYSNWQTPTNDDAALQTLLSHDFDPHHTVLVAAETPVGQAPGDPKADPGTVSIDIFKPKYVKLQASASAPAILMLNDRVAPDWKAWVDQKPVSILRCNYLMRGVFLTPGRHTVEFRFEPRLTTLWLTLCAWGVGVLTAGYVIWSRKPAPKPVPVEAAKPSPAPVTAAAPSRPRPAGKQKKRR